MDIIIAILVKICALLILLVPIGAICVLLQLIINTVRRATGKG